MNIKDKVLNKIADFMYKYKSDDIDEILNCSVKGKIKSAVITTNGEFIKDIKTKEYDGVIDINKMLEKEINQNEMQEIVFCDNGRIVCLTNQKGSSYVETSHEFFDLAKENVYIMCKDKESYKSLKEYLKQSSKWKRYVVDKEEIPYKNVFEKLFNIQSKPNVKQKENSAIKENETDKNIKNNKIIIDGYIVNKGKPLLRSDNKKVVYLTINQEDTYNGNTKNYNITVSMNAEVLENYGGNINIGDKVKITGKLVNYIDKNNNKQSIVNGYDFEILKRSNEKNNEEELNR